MKRSDFIKTTLGLLAIPFFGKAKPKPMKPPYKNFLIGGYDVSDRDIRASLLREYPKHHTLELMKARKEAWEKANGMTFYAHQ